MFVHLWTNTLHHPVTDSSQGLGCVIQIVNPTAIDNKFNIRYLVPMQNAIIGLLFTLTNYTADVSGESTETAHGV